MASLAVSRLFGVAGKTAVVTGGGAGIGAMITEALVQNGATVFITSRKADVCEAAAAKFTEQGPGKCIAIPQDLGTTEGCLYVAIARAPPACPAHHPHMTRCASRIPRSAAMEQLAGHTDKLHILVNNAGTTWGEPLEKYQDKGTSWFACQPCTVASC